MNKSMINYNLYNLSSVVSPTQLSNMSRALNNFLLGFCADWNLSPVQVVIVTYNSHIPIPNNSLLIMDYSDAGDGILGYHYEDNGRSIAKIFARTTLNFGGGILYIDNSTFTVSMVLAHEMLEMVGNPEVSKWALSNDGLLYACEMCDAVESNLIVATLPGNIKVALSDYLLPNWFSPDSVSGKFNKSNTLRAPFTIDTGGYSIVIDIVDGFIDVIYGATHPGGTASLVSLNSKDIANDLKELSEKMKLKIKPKS